MDRTISIPLFICLLAVGVFSWVGLVMNSVWIFIPVALITFLVYLATFHKKMPLPEKILPLYLIALGVQMLHFAEEYLNGFVVEFPQVFSQEAYPEAYWVVFNMAAYAFFLVGGIVLFKQIKELSVIPLFFILVGVILNPLAHLALTVYNGAYFPGVYTSIIYLFLAPFIIKAILPDKSV